MDDDAAFLLAVEANIARSLPLSLADRKESRPVSGVAAASEERDRLETT